MYDEFKLTFNLNKNVVDFAVEINNVRIHYDLALNLVALVKSCQTEGEFYIFTCECGEPQCGGIYHGVNVVHLTEIVVWDLLINGTEHQFKFDPTKYQNNIDKVICEMKILHKNESSLIQLPIFGQRWEDFLKLSTQVFSTRLNVPEKRVIAEFVEIHSCCQTINVSGIDFDVDELFLPKVLVEQYKSWMKHAANEFNEKETPEFLEFLNEGRLFSFALKKYLGKQVRLKYFPPKQLSNQPSEVLELFGYIK